MKRPAIVFIGFMGAGKSTALDIARRAGLETTEIDSMMEESFGMPIKEAFEIHGEEGFRAREAELVGELLENADGGAIALGGGSILSERIRAALGRHVVVWLQIDPQEAWRRIAHSNRPLATSAEDVERLLATRLPLYEELADAIVPMGSRSTLERAMPAIQALPKQPAGTHLLWAMSSSGEYPILVGRGILESEWWPLEGRRFCVADSTVMALYADRLEPLSERIEVPPGEGAKSMAEAERVLESLAEAEMRKQDHVVALGGGVVGDLAGLCAHLFQRGVPVVQVPTTVVAQVDSAYGGKTGVDLPQGKNQAGAYHMPAAVLADPTTLATLPREDLAAGFVEVLKTGLLAGGTLWERVRSIERLDPDDLDDVIFACARYKCEVVAADERDSGLRNVLNFGHTVGHAIEAVSSFTGYRHGDAVGLGMLAALRLSEAPELRDELATILSHHGLPTEISGRDEAQWTEAILAAMQHDKKASAEGVGFVLLSVPGEPRTGQLLEPARVRAAVEELFA